MKKKKSTLIGIVVSTLEDLVISTLEELADFVENVEEPLVFNGGHEDNPVRSDIAFLWLGYEEEEEEE